MPGHECPNGNPAPFRVPGADRGLSLSEVGRAADTAPFWVPGAVRGGHGMDPASSCSMLLVRTGTRDGWRAAKRPTERPVMALGGVRIPFWGGS